MPLPLPGFRPIQATWDGLVNLVTKFIGACAAVGVDAGGAYAARLGAMFNSLRTNCRTRFST